MISVQQLLSLGAPPSPLSARPELRRSVVERSAVSADLSWKSLPNAMKNGSCSATTVAGSAALPFVSSTGAPKERSGEICGFSGPFLEKLTQRDEKRVLFSNYCRWERRPPLCQLDRSSEGA